ncbi:uncharacterized protein MAM_04312 [Metarhizium album ARSEF 1941]|uniref:Uncharacterized protein n=1 Tax=Metarhizium album (strain ARSEF 1941) TaxID=1081103 RepID=A0A0B2WV17_METAS|nr:uncharacterized protein MAM_04312 [Metarhizium album ARSEF 1941]KHN97923.1 hypothetical protein MAM_04312 [Metarhizium album ARSEF 1941]
MVYWFMRTDLGLIDSTESEPSESPTETALAGPGPVAENKAWIAGAVIGPVVLALALALVLGCVFYFRPWAKKMKKAREGAANTDTPPPEAWGFSVPGEHAAHEYHGPVPSSGFQIAPGYAGAELA